MSMSTAVLNLPTPTAPEAPRPVAPAWHTALLLLLMLGLALAGALFQAHERSAPSTAEATAPRDVVSLYLSLIAAQVGLLVYVTRAGLSRTGTKLEELIGRRWTSRRHAFVDIGLAIGLWTLWQAVGWVWERTLGAGHAASIAMFLPRGPAESALWIAVSVTAGFVEEFVFRGYLMRQFTAWTGRPWLGLVLQAAVFGIAHGYQGVMACARIAAYGALFGLLAAWRRSLVPGMIGHALHDVLAGIARL